MTARPTIEVDKEKLMNVWACLILAVNNADYMQEAYHWLYMAWNDHEDADPFDAFSEWWTGDEADAALERMREGFDEPGKDKGTTVQRDGEGL